jgi:nicotinamide phosphoribosyltransferase
MPSTNLLTLTDSYKLSHYKQYPQGSQHVFSYFESRVGAKFDSTVFFGLQAILKEYLVGQVVTEAKIADAKSLIDAHMGPGLFNTAGWTRLLQKHGGTLPVRIRAVLEGTAVPTGHVLMTMEDTDPEFPWLTNYLETLLVQVWYPSTVATQSREMKKTILKYLTETGDPSLIGFKLHDFGFRGSTSVESAGLGGMAHLVNFMGTDTLRGLEYARDYYAAGICGFSIPASEHSTITSWGREHENDAMRNMLEQYPTGLVACVSDSWDIFNACANIWGKELREKILSRDGVLVIRPDSGDPVDIVPRVMRLLGERFGQSMNDKGYLVLDKHVRMIQGDGITADSLGQILEAVKVAGYSADNLAFGSGGGLLQKVDRDTQRFAFKCSAIQVNGGWRDVYKAPATDPTKNSKAGRLTLYRDKLGAYITDTVDTLRHKGKAEDVMVTVFENGRLLIDQNFAAVRSLAGRGL